MKFLKRMSASETLSGGIMLGAAVLALVMANSPLGDSYENFRDFTLGPLDVRHWIQDGLLTLFFMVAGLELRHELTHGTLRNPRNAALPIFAALGGMVVPALLYLAISDQNEGWTIPMATDIAFALAVLAVFGRGLPNSLRVFLLTLAIVDDVVAILIIAIAFTKDINLLALLAALLCLTVYGITQRMGWGWSALPLAILAWYTLHESGVHATVAGVALGLLTIKTSEYDARLRPVSSGIVLPLFAFVSAGISMEFLSTVFADRAAIAVIVGLVAGKIIGITGVAYVLGRFTRAELAPGLSWADVLAVSCVAGIGFTVSLLLASLSFGSEADHMIGAVLIASLIATVLSALGFSWRKAAWANRNFQ